MEIIYRSVIKAIETSISEAKFAGTSIDRFVLSRCEYNELLRELSLRSPSEYKALIVSETYLGYHIQVKPR